MPDTRPHSGNWRYAILLAIIGSAMLLVAALEVSGAFVWRPGACLLLLIVGSMNLIVAPFLLRKNR